jgi:hypothetical protein
MLTYSQSTGRWERSGVLIGVGYAGAGAGKNNPELEGVRDVGPIPRGIYSFGEPQDTEEHGKFAMRLHPDDATRQRIIELDRGPDTFWLHGDSIEHPGLASKGCPVASRPTRVRVWESKERVEVIR